MHDLEALLQAVQHNCDISDARFAGQQTLCVYLLQMREHFRWEKRLPLGATLPKADVGHWLTAREQHWEDIEGRDFCPLPLAQGPTDPFDYERVNDALVPNGYVYSSGIGRYGKPHFFLASLSAREEREGFSIYRSGIEHARDLNGPPAMLHGRSIFIREDLARRWLWEKIEEHRWHKTNTAMQRALTAYGLIDEPGAALETLVRHEIESMVLHELGEGRAGIALGPEWEELLAALPRSRAEIVARALRDNLADCLVTLPTLLAHDHDGPLHFYFGQLQGMRRQLFPEAVGAYRRFADTNDRGVLAPLIGEGRTRFAALANELLTHYRAQGAEAAAREIETRIAPPCTVGDRPRAAGVQ